MADFDVQLASIQYTVALETRLQQEQSLLRGKVREGAHTGKGVAPIQYASPFAMENAGPPGSVKSLNTVASMRRWCSPIAKSYNQIIDQFEQQETLIRPESAFVAESAMAVGRAFDDIIIDSFFATASTGTDFTGSNSSTETWAQAQTAATGSSTGLTVGVDYGTGSNASGLTLAKIMKAQAIFHWLHVDRREPKCLVIGPQQWLDLMQQDEVVNMMYRGDGNRPMEDGVVGNLMGFDIIITDRLPVLSSSSTTRQCAALSRGGMYLGVWKNMSTRVSIREDLESDPLQIYTSVMAGATRLEPGRLIEIDCGNDSFGGDPSGV